MLGNLNGAFQKSMDFLALQLEQGMASKNN